MYKLLLLAAICACVLAQNSPAPPYVGTYYNGINTSLNGAAFQVFVFLLFYFLLWLISFLATINYFSVQ